MIKFPLNSWGRTCASEVSHQCVIQKRHVPSWTIAKVKTRYYWLEYTATCYLASLFVYEVWRSGWRLSIIVLDQRRKREQNWVDDKIKGTVLTMGVVAARSFVGVREFSANRRFNVTLSHGVTTRLSTHFFLWIFFNISSTFGIPCVHTCATFLTLSEKDFDFPKSHSWNSPFSRCQRRERSFEVEHAFNLKVDVHESTEDVLPISKKTGAE